MAAHHSVDITRLDVTPAAQRLVETGDALAKVARDTAYTTVGLGILAYQRLQVRRRELERERRRDG
ncbi:MAG: hypothetical protein AB8G26_03055 [Ilumatobacter sp.]